MTNAEQVTHTRNEFYDLVSVLYHALKSGETYERYIRDAEDAGDRDCAEFFHALQVQDRQRAARAKDLLDKHFH
jgi:hypothetical protein